MQDNNEADDKIIAVAEGDPSVNHINDISELPPHFTAELRHFFEMYTKLEHKRVVVEDFFGKTTAIEIFNESFEMYKANFVSIN